MLALTACANNIAQQHYLLGQQYYRAQNYGDAFNEISKAAKQGNADAQYALGYMYFNGVGTAVDNQTGLFWIKQAANQNQPQALKALNLLNNKSVTTIKTL
jgi:TPR repeat protein